MSEIPEERTPGPIVQAREQVRRYEASRGSDRVSATLTDTSMIGLRMPAWRWVAAFGALLGLTITVTAAWKDLSRGQADLVKRLDAADRTDQTLAARLESLDGTLRMLDKTMIRLETQWATEHDTRKTP